MALQESGRLGGCATGAGADQSCREHDDSGSGGYQRSAAGIAAPDQQRQVCDGADRRGRRKSRQDLPD
jgi:hypothetical protein